MSALLRKLQYTDQERIYVRGAPAEFDPHVAEMRGVTTVGTGTTCKIRFRHAGCIESLQRDPRRAMSAQGRERAGRGRSA